MTKTPNKLQIQKQPTRKQMSRAERDAAASRRVWLAVGGVLAVAILLLAYGYLRQSVFIFNEPVANVNGEVITTRQFQNQVKLTELQLQQQLLIAQQLGDQTSYQNYLNELQDPTTLGSQVINGMVDDLLLKQNAASFGVSITDDEVQKSIEQQLNYDRNPPTPGPTSTPRPVPTASGPITQTATPSITPRPTATPVTLDGFNQLYQQQISQLAQLGMGEQEFRDWRKTALLASKVRSAISSAVPTMTDQIKFQYIRAAADQALTVTTAVNTQGFAAIYQEVVSGTYPITSVYASDTGGWVPQEAISSTTELGPVVAKELFATPISQTVAVINQSGSATYFAFIQDHQVGPLDSNYLQSQQQAAVEAWLAERRKSDFIFTWNDRVPVAAIPNLPSSSGPIATP